MTSLHIFCLLLYSLTIIESQSVLEPVSYLTFIIKELIFENDSYKGSTRFNYSLTLSLFSSNDFQNAIGTISTKESLINFGFNMIPLVSMKDLRFHMKTQIYDVTTEEIREHCDPIESIALAIKLDNIEITKYLCNKFKITYKFNYTCLTKTSKTNKSCVNDDSDLLKYDPDHYLCVRGKMCQSLLNKTDQFNCTEPDTETTSTSTTSTSTISTRKSTSTSTRTSFTTRITTLNKRSTISNVSLKNFEKVLKPNEDNISLNSSSCKGRPMQQEQFCISKLTAIGIAAGLIAVAVLNIACLIALRRNHASCKHLLCGNENDKKKDNQGYHGNEALYSAPWDERENKIMDHLFVSMPDIRENLRKSEHIYEVPQKLLNNSNGNLVQYRNQPNAHEDDDDDDNQSINLDERVV